MNKNLWYAIMQDDEDQDWGTGTYDLDDAIQQVKSLRSSYPDAYIAVISLGADPICIDEIRIQ